MSNLLAKLAEKHGGELLPDNAQYTNRFHIKSGSSDSLYVVAQNKKTGVWSCGCFGWRRWRKCQHLDAMMPALEAISESQANRAVEAEKANPVPRIAKSAIAEPKPAKAKAIEKAPAKAKPAKAKAKAKPAKAKPAKAKAKKPKPKSMVSKDKVKVKLGCASIYCMFKGKRTNAIFNPETQEVTIGKKEFKSPSAAGRHITGYRVNGWRFWRDAEYECFLDDCYTR